MADIKDRAREYLGKNSEYNEVFGEFFVAVDTMTAMIEFAEQETKELKAQIEIDAKQIRALQKQNGELTDKVADLKEEINKIAFARGNLEEENAELKETLKTYNGCGDWDNDFHTCRVYLQHEELQKCVDQLTKAKELLKRFIELENCTLDYDDIKEAEQFLSEVNK